MDALYFPNLTLPSLAWAHPVILYFDNLGIIGPLQYELGLSEPSTARLVEAGLVRPMMAGLFEDHVEEDARLVDRLARGARRRNWSRTSVSLYSIHAGKLAHTSLVDQLVREKVLQPHPDDGRWLVGPEHICLQIMIVLAQRIVRAGDAAAIVTDETPAFRISTGLAGSWKSYDSRRLDAVTRLLPVAHWASPDQLLTFKGQHFNELRRFRQFVEQLVRRDEEDGDFHARLTEAERLRNHLCGELDAIEARADAQSLALAIANFVAPLLEASFLSAAANGLTALHSRAADARRGREIDREELVYAAKASRTLRASTSSQILA